MGWIKEANKLGRYEMTYQGFRIYCSKEPSTTDSKIEKPNGIYSVTEFHKGHFIAIDSTGSRFEASNIEVLGVKIDSELVRRYYSKKDGVELEWRQPE